MIKNNSAIVVLILLVQHTARLRFRKLGMMGFLIINADMAKHLGVKDGDSWLEIDQVAVPGGVFLTKHHRIAPPSSEGGGIA